MYGTNISNGAFEELPSSNRPSLRTSNSTLHYFENGLNRPCDWTKPPQTLPYQLRSLVQASQSSCSMQGVISSRHDCEAEGNEMCTAEYRE